MDDRIKRFPKPADLEARWLLRVEKEGHGGCWRWIGATWALGYGKFTLPGGQGRTGAHRWGYQHFVGPVADDLDLDHLCRNAWCVNPEHLEPVSHAVNVRRGIAGMTNAARCAAITHCPHGHEYTPENTYVRAGSGRTGRNCRACGAAVTKRRKAKARERKQQDAVSLR